MIYKISRLSCQIIIVVLILPPIISDSAWGQAATSKAKPRSEAQERLLENAMKASGTGLVESASLKKSRELLGQMIKFSFNKDPFDNLLKYIRANSFGPAGPGLQIYVDPVGLRESKRTITTPIQISGEMSIADAITKATAQLGLAAYLGRYGEVVITKPSRAESLLKLSLLEEAAMTKVSAKGETRVGPSGSIVTLTPRLSATLGALKQAIAMQFPRETPLIEVLRYTKSLSTVPPELSNGIAFYIDPIGLRDAGQNLASTVSIDVEGVPVATVLTMVVRQLGLTAYLQRNGLVIITTPARVELYKSRPDALSDGTFRSLAPFTLVVESATLPARKATPQQRKTKQKLNEPINVLYPKSTPLEEIFEYLRLATGEGEASATNGLSFGVDPAALKKNPALIRTPVVLDLDGFPLSTSLNLIASQIDMDASVKPDGSVVFTPRPTPKGRK